MAIKLENKPNVIAPGGAYPYGDIKDNSGANDGTPINRATHADFHQFFARMLALSGVTANGLPDNNTNGFQYYEALIGAVATIFPKKLIQLTDNTTDFNTITTPGFYAFSSTALSGFNAPAYDGGGINWQIIVLGESLRLAQIAVHNGNFIFHRFYNNFSGWSSWERIYKLSEATAALALKVNKAGDVISGTLEVGGGIRTAASGAYLKTTVVNIGDWNMDAVSGITVALSIDFKKIRSINGMIRSDDDTTYTAFGTYPPGSTDAGIDYIDNIGVNLVRGATGIYDSTSYDSTSFNRGWLHIVYEA